MADMRNAQNGIGLGIDAGGTQTRWALANADGDILGEGALAGLASLQMGSASAIQAVRTSFSILATAVLALGRPSRIHAGLTGFGGDGEQLAGMLAELFKVGLPEVTLCKDFEIAYLDCFEPGEGYLIYAGTGSIGAWMDESGQWHRAGGRGVALDDGGGGYWIAREALRQIWRGEDECPGRWESSPMAHAVFAQIGGSDWACSRQFIYGQERGEVGKLALAVAASADADPVARDILQRAGLELARLALALTLRFGARPVVLAGRASGLHPLLAQSMRAALPGAISLTQTTVHAHFAAARIAARASSSTPPAPVFPLQADDQAIR